MPNLAGPTDQEPSWMVFGGLPNRGKFEDHQFGSQVDDHRYLTGFDPLGVVITSARPTGLAGTSKYQS
jgi:hypothetical protein